MTTDPLTAQLADKLAAYADCTRWVIGFSGGLDSTTLLHLCAAIPGHPPILALHINHQLQSCAAHWEQHCADVAERLGVEFKVCRVRPQGQSEDAARNARYEAFANTLNAGDLLVLAQHANDQSETFLQRLLRGAGMRGLSAMAAEREFSGVPLLRPLLDVNRKQLETWARKRQLEWIEDPSNRDDNYTRNWLRNVIVPQLKQRFPQLDQRIGETCEQMRETNALLLERAREDAVSVEVQTGVLDLDKLALLSLPRQRNLLHYWIRHYSEEAVGRDFLSRVQREVIAAAVDASPRMAIGHYELRRYRRQLYLVTRDLPSVTETSIKLQSSEYSLSCGCLSISSAESGLPGGEYQLGYRRDGDRVRPSGRGGSVKLKQLFQERGIPPWQRDYWPLLRRDGEIVAIPGICICEGRVINGGFALKWVPYSLSKASHFGRL